MTADLDEYREQSRATWGEMAPGWEDRNQWMVETTNPVSEWLLGAASPEAGQVVLDIAAGPGDLGLRAAKRVGAEGRVISTDFAPEMVDAARRLGEAANLTNVDYRVLDAEAMDLPDDSVDVALCRWGYMLMGDPAAALRETRRVLRDGGPLAFAVWASPELNPWATVPAITLVEEGHLPAPEPGAPGIFAMADADRIRELTTGAGFAQPTIERIEFDFRYADFDDLWDTIVRIAGPLARVINSLPEERRQATREAISERFDSFRDADGSYEAPGVSWGVIAR